MDRLRASGSRFSVNKDPANTDSLQTQLDTYETKIAAEYELSVAAQNKDAADSRVAIKRLKNTESAQRSRSRKRNELADLKEENDLLRNDYSILHHRREALEAALLEYKSLYEIELIKNRVRAQISL
jgi:hypothetical protein